MTLNSVLFMLFGAALVAGGVLASALADRIRNLRVMREAAPRQSRAPSAPITIEEPAELPRPKLPRTPQPKPSLATEGGEDVIAALIASGFKKPIATEAAWACTAPERATVETWTMHALRRCARGGMS
jgi:hypothetical protein